MPLGYEYKRYFIILQEEDKGYEMTAGKIPTGYVKIEIKKNKVKIGGFIQNMKSDEKSKYRLNLLAPKEKLILDIGLFRMDNNGRGEFYAELDSDNVYNSNIPISEFTGALVVAGSGVPLAGYAGRDSIPWRDWYSKGREEKAVKTIDRESEEPVRVDEEQFHIPEKEEMREAEVVEEIKKDNISEIEEVRQEEIIEIEDVREEEIVEIKEPRIEDSEERSENIEEIEVEWHKEMEEKMEEVRQPEETKEPAGIDFVESDRMAENIYYTEEDEGLDVSDVKRETNIIENDEEYRDTTLETQFRDAEDIEMRAEPAPLYYEEPVNMERYSFHESDMSNLTDSAEITQRHSKKEKMSENKVHNRLSNAIKNMDRFDDFYSEYGIRWYRIGRRLPLLNDVIIPMNGSMMPLSHPFISETNGRNIENCVLGVEHRRGEIRYVYIGIPGPYHEACRPCYEYRGFTNYKRTRSGRRGYWIMCIDIVKGRICRV